MVVALAGCRAGTKAAADTGTRDSGASGGSSGDTEEDPSPPFHIEWTDSHLSVVASQSIDATGWSVGLCASSDDFSNDWFGEGCVVGDTLEDGTGVSYCHSMEPSGVNLEFGGDRAALAAGTTAVPPTWAANTQVMIFAPEWDFSQEHWRNDSVDCFIFGTSLCTDTLFQYCQVEAPTW